ncbi:MAG: neutral/alkaline non-lysosomal ceramidase N-terminal domain-containing protein [bacterium]|nr:neutral/alkaline non-lysosomal ceramidase N-terminal domain-containing protein [bacterium]
MAKETRWKAGLGCVDVTPSESMDMSGYAARKKPSEGVRDPLCAKALVIEDEQGERGLLLTVDLIGFDRAFSDAICASIGEKTGLERRQIVINASHTHGGPVFGSRYQDEPVAVYNEMVKVRLVEAAVLALKDLKPARFSTAMGVAHFAMNRRRFTPRDVINAPYPRGYADRSVPVLRVEGEDGALRAALFLYACHNTTLVSDNLKFSSDYAGFAQRYVEKENPGALAMFAQGCGGDVVPYPRGTYELAKLHGEVLGAEVCRLLTEEEFQPVNGPLQIVFDTVDLPLAGKPAPEKLEALRAKGGHDVQQAERLAKMVEEDAEWPDHYQMPIGMWQFGEDLTIVHLATEVVSDYIPLLERRLGPLGLWVLAYCNDYFGYIPSARVHREGGYEARGMIRGYGALVPEVEGAILEKAAHLAREVGRRLPAGA